jgi:hypothetical protein
MVTKKHGSRHGIFAAAVAAALLASSAAQAQGNEWSKLPRMQLERQFAGPLQDTIIQRWRDPVDGAVCYIYLPITAAHTPPTPTGYVQYGPNTIGTLSCLPGPAGVKPMHAEAPAKPAPAPVQHP